MLSLLMNVSASSVAANPSAAVLQKVPVTDLSDILITLLFVVALILVCGWIVKRWMSGQTGGLANNQHMKILAILPLGTRERMAIIQVGSEQLVVGITAQSINTLHVLETPIDVSQPQSESLFQQKLTEIMKSGLGTKKEKSS